MSTNYGDGVFGKWVWADCGVYRPQLGTTVGVDVDVDGSVEEST